MATLFGKQKIGQNLPRIYPTVLAGFGANCKVKAGGLCCIFKILFAIQAQGFILHIMTTERLHFEDFPVGAVVPFGDALVRRAELIEFAAEFEPQALHMDDEAAEETPLGGLSASGWHTCCMMMRKMCDGFLLNSTSLGSPGIEDVKWMKPVRPGDRLHFRYTVLEARASNSRPDVGLVKFLFEALNAEDVLVMSMATVIMFRRRSATSVTPALDEVSL